MSRWMIGIFVVLAVLLLLPLAGKLFNRTQTTRTQVGVTTPLHSAAAQGEKEKVEQLLSSGSDPKAVDEQGKTPLHLAAEHGHLQTTTVLLERGADANVIDVFGKQAVDYAAANNHGGTAAAIRPYTTRKVSSDRAASAEKKPDEEDNTQHLNPSLKYPDLASFEATIGQSACLLKSDHVYVFAPKIREEAAKIVLPYLTKAYDALYAIVGVHTQYIIVVYNFPPGHKDARGGTSNCTLWYDDTNLDLTKHEEWTRYNVPHVSGYIEEMAHNFVAATRAQFGWEMVGWRIGTIATATVAANPIVAHAVQTTQQGQADTYKRYREQGFIFPMDLPPNQVDRIHAYILWECEQQYGPDFWKDFFAEVRKEKQALQDVAEDRDRRYQITVECFNRLPGINFKQRLTENQISLTRDIKSLKPEEPGWNRRLQ